MELKRQCGQTACFHANRCRTCLQRSGAQGPKPRRAFDEAGKRHSLQEEGVPSFRFLFGVQRRHLSSERPLVCMRARTGVCMRARAHGRGACLACRLHFSCQWRCSCSMTCCMHAHEARARPRSPRARQRRSLAGGTDADRCMPFAFSLACMPCDVVSDLHAACHAKCRSPRCAVLTLRSDRRAHRA